MSEQSPSSLFVGKGLKPQYLTLSKANRHGLIAGATGTGKTVSLQILAEGFSKQGVPVFMADVKGDLSGISQTGTANPALSKRAETIGLGDYVFTGFPVAFWDVFGEQGHPARTTVSEMGPLLLSRQLDLNDTQEGVLTVAFRLADEEGLLLLDLKDLRELLSHMGENTREVSSRYGHVTNASIGAIQRRLLTLEDQGGDRFFGEPALRLSDMIARAPDGRGQINILAANRLIRSPRVYSAFLLWLLSELFEDLPEVGDPDKPRFVFFFDEAHLLFDHAPKHLLDRIAQTVKLIRSKGVGVYFVTQSPLDIPDEVLGQLGNRIQHALRAFTPRDAKTVRAVAQTFRENPKINVEETITQLGIGEALTSFLDGKGIPSPVDKTLIRPPSSRLGPATDAERRDVLAESFLSGRYDVPVDRESAYEVLRKRAEERAETEQEKTRRAEAERAEKAASPRAPSGSRSRRQGYGETLAKSVLRQVGTAIGRHLIRGILGSLTRK